MVGELWDSFPRLIEQNINGLLDRAEPNPQKAFHLYRLCKSEDLWQESYERFAQRLSEFYARPKSQRSKADLDAFLDRPMHRSVYESFHLNFRTAAVPDSEVRGVASWAHNLMRVGHKTNSVVISIDVLTKTLSNIVHPPLFEKAADIEFEDFCAAWRKTVFKAFGNRYDPEFHSILRELHWLHLQLKESEKTARERRVFPTIYLTQTEIDWTLAVRQAALTFRVIPKFPLSRGPQKQRLIDLERAALLYNLVQPSRLPELLKHRDAIRTTIISRCDSLIREKAA